MAGKLTALQIKHAGPGKHFDGGGLYLEVMANGSRYWHFKYRCGGKEKRLSLGVWPTTSLADARQRHEEERQRLAQGIDPGTERKAGKAQAKLNADHTFQAVALEWLAQQQPRFAAATCEKARWTFDDLVFPWIGQRPIADIDPPEMLGLLRRIEERGAHETAHRTKQRCGQVFRYAIATGRARHDPVVALRGALAPPISRSRAAITAPAKVGEWQLAHAERNKVRAAYNRAQRMDERKRMMQAWAISRWVMPWRCWRVRSARVVCAPRIGGAQRYGWVFPRLGENLEARATTAGRLLDHGWTRDLSPW